MQEQGLRDFYTVKQWCEKNSISRPSFYKFKKEYNLPKITKLKKFNKCFISKEADAEWLDFLRTQEA